MAIKTPLYDRLVADGTVSGLVGTRIYRKVAPQEAAKPYVTFQGISAPRIHGVKNSLGVVQERIQFDCWADTDSGAEAVADAIRASLDGFTGTLGSIRVQGCTHLDERPGMEPPIGGGETPIHRVSQDYMVSYEE